MQCEKVGFATKRLAVIRIKEIKKEYPRQDRKPVRAYKCDNCKMWHLTSQTKQEYNAMKKEFREVGGKVSIDVVHDRIGYLKNKISDRHKVPPKKRYKKNR